MLRKREKIALSIGITIAAAGFIAGAVGFLKGLEASREDAFSDAVVATFRDELTEHALAEGIFPIEGFDAQLLLGGYPGLEKSDFDKVISFEGVYHYENQELRYERTAGQPITSAEKTIAVEGYRTLLSNIVDRLQIEVVDSASAEALVQRLKNGDE